MNILVISDSLEKKTGYNTLALMFIDYLKKYHSFYYTAQFTKNKNVFFEIEKVYPDFEDITDIPYIPINIKKGIPEKIIEIINDCKIDLVITFGDIWSVISIFEAKFTAKFKWLHYLITETDNLGQINTFQNWKINCKTILESIDYIVPHSRMSLKVAKSWGIKTKNIIHPIIQRWSNIKNSKYENIILPECYINNNKKLRRDNQIRILIVANNSYRKNIDTIFHAFKLLKEIRNGQYRGGELFKSKDLILTLNIHPLTSFQGWDILQLIEEYKLQQNVIIFKEPLNDVQLSSIYSDSDLFLNASYAEGIGLPVIDAMLHNIEVITLSSGLLKYFVPKHSLIKEQPDQSFYPPNLIQKWTSINPKILAEKLLNKILQMHNTNKINNDFSNRDVIRLKFPNRKNVLKWKKLLEKI